MNKGFHALNKTTLSCDAPVPQESDERAERIASLLEKARQELEGGKPHDRHSLLAENPDIAEELASGLESLEFILQVAPHVEGSGFPVGEDSATATEPPKTLGDFRIVRQLGRGGMGVVYEAEQQSLSRRVALKVLPFAAILDQRQLQRFHNEARAAAMLKHPNIVGVYAVGCERGVHFYAMELIEGHTLADVIAHLRETGENRDPTDVSFGSDEEAALDHDGDVTESHKAERSSGTPCSARRSGHTLLNETGLMSASSTKSAAGHIEYYRSVARLGRDAALALHHAHQEGLIHRDVKPSNLMIDRRGKLWITDFGLAQFHTDHSLTATGDLLGTLRYMSPERFDDRHLVDHRCDIYALGITLYELATRSAAFHGENRQQVIQRVLTEELTPPSRITKTVPRDLETIILKATAKTPEVRFSTAEELAADLDRFLLAKPIHARRITTCERVWRWTLRNRMLAAALLAALTLLIFLAVAGPIVAIHQAELISKQQKTQEKLTQQVYDSGIRAIHAAVQRREYDLARKLLDECLPSGAKQDLRGPEWHYLHREIARANKGPMSRSFWPSYCVRFSPDDRLLADGGIWGQLTVRNAKSLQELWNSQDHDGSIRSLIFAHDGSLIITASVDRTIKIWDAESGKCLHTAEMVHRAESLAMSRDGKLLAVGCAREEREYNQVAPVLLFHFESSTTNADSSVKLSLLTEFNGVKGKVEAMSFSSDGTYLAIGGFSPTISVWDIASQELCRELNTNGQRVFDVAFSPRDPAFLACAVGSHDIHGSHTIQLWEVNGTEMVQIFPDDEAKATEVTFLENGQRLAYGGRGRILRIWDIGLKRPVETLVGPSHSIMDIDVASNGKQLATSSFEGAIRNFPLGLDPSHHDRFEGHSAAILDLAVSRDGSLLVSTSDDSTARVWNTETGQCLNFIPGNFAELMAVDISLDNTLIALGGGDFMNPDTHVEVFLWDRNKQARRRTLFSASAKDADARTIHATRFSPDGKSVAATIGKDVCLWNTETGEQLLRWRAHDTHHITRLLWPHSVGYIITCSAGAEIRLWDPTSGDFIGKIDTPQQSHSALAISRDGATLAAAGNANGDISLFDLANRRHLRDLKGHVSPVFGLDFSPDGKRLLSSGPDAVKLWNLTSIADLLTFNKPGMCVWRVKFHPKGRAMFAANAHLSDSDIFVWRTSSVE